MVDGVIGIITDVTELKERELDLQAQAKEKRQLMANEAAAKEASRLKSQFLANVGCCAKHRRRNNHQLILVSDVP